MSKNPRFALIAFDLDGTLADTESRSLPDAVEMFNEEYGVPVTLEYWLENYHGLAGQTLLNHIEADFGTHIPLPDFLASRARRVERMFSQGVQPAPGMLQVLKGLAVQGCQMCICSNSAPARIALTLRHLTGQHAAGLILPNMFENHIFSGQGADGLGKTKPAPDVYLAAAQHYGVAPANALAVEDTTTGVKAAVAAGFTCIGYTGLLRHPKEEGAELAATGAAAVIPHWDDFLPLLAKLA